MKEPKFEKEQACMENFQFGIDRLTVGKALAVATAVCSGCSGGGTYRPSKRSTVQVGVGAPLPSVSSATSSTIGRAFGTACQVS